MNLSFTRQFGDWETQFIEKIWTGFPVPEEKWDQSYEDIYYNAIGWPEQGICPAPKLHTIRHDKNGRWREGMDIHFRTWKGKPYRSESIRFAPIIPCVSVQKIEIKWNPIESFGIPDIYIDGEYVIAQDMERLAINDGFPSLQKFYEWFNEDFTGVIIHWTDLKY